MLNQIRKIDSANRLKIPKGIIKALDIRKGDSIEIFTDKDRIVLKKFILKN